MKARGHPFLLFVAVLALASISAQAVGVEFAATDAKTSAGSGDAPVACKSDADCPHLACGPCTAGAPITQSMLGGPECAVNPCLDAGAVCNERQTCEISPRTRKNPAVWKKPQS